MAQYTSEKFNLSEYGDGTSQYSISLNSDSDVIVFSEETGEPLGGYPTIRASTFFGAAEETDGYFVATAEGCLLDNGTEEGTDELNNREVTLKSINGSSGKINFSWWPNGVDEEPLLTKTFTVTKIISNIDYDLIIDKAVINLDNIDDRKVNITVLKKTSEGTQTLTEADDIINLYRDNSTDPITSWEDIEITETTKFIIKGEIENREITFDEEIIETVNNGVSLQVQYVNSNTEPDNNANWQTTIPNSVNGQYTWVRQKLSTDTTWSTPIRLTGEDAGDVKYIYYLKSANGNAPTTPTSDPASTAQGPGAWTNNPTGISSQYPEEYMSFKTKSSGPNAEWTSYSTPALWSKWGDKGQDGAGVIYKFYRQQNNTTPPTYSSSTSAQWSDNPQGVTSTYKYEYVAVIKTYYNESGNLVENTTNVSVSLWNHYVKDGDPAKDFDIAASAYVFAEDSNGNISGSITFTAKPKNLTNPTYSWTEQNGSYSDTATYTLNANNFGTGSSYTVTCYCKQDGRYFGSDSITIYRVPKGSTGASGDDAIVIGLTNGNMTFNKANTTATEVTTVIANSGSNAASYSSSTPTSTNNSSSGWQYTISKNSNYVSINSSNGEIIVTNPQEETSISITIAMYYNGTKKNEKEVFINCSLVEDGDNGTSSAAAVEEYHIYYAGSAPPSLPDIPGDQNQPTLSNGWQDTKPSLQDTYIWRSIAARTKIDIRDGEGNITTTTYSWGAWSAPQVIEALGSNDAQTIATINNFMAVTNGGEKKGIYYTKTNGDVVTNLENFDPDNDELHINADMINTGTFRVSDGDNTVFSAAAGGTNVTIGNFNVTATGANSGAIYSGKESLNDSNAGVYLGTDGIALGSKNIGTTTNPQYVTPFQVNTDGELTAISGDIGGWEISSNKLSYENCTLFANNTETEYSAVSRDNVPIRIKAGIEETVFLTEPYTAYMDMGSEGYPLTNYQSSYFGPMLIIEEGGYRVENFFKSSLQVMASYSVRYSDDGDEEIEPLTYEDNKDSSGNYKDSKLSFADIVQVYQDELDLVYSVEEGNLNFMRPANDGVNIIITVYIRETLPSFKLLDDGVVIAKQVITDSLKVTNRDYYTIREINQLVFGNNGPVFDNYYTKNEINDNFYKKESVYQKTETYNKTEVNNFLAGCLKSDNYQIGMDDNDWTDFWS